MDPDSFGAIPTMSLFDLIWSKAQDWNKTHTMDTSRFDDPNSENEWYEILTTKHPTFKQAVVHWTHPGVLYVGQPPSKHLKALSRHIKARRGTWSQRPPTCEQPSAGQTAPNITGLPVGSKSKGPSPALDPETLYEP